MRTTVIAGLALAASAVALMLVGDALDLGVDAVTLLGVALGAVVALVPDATPGRRLAAFATGFAIGLVGYAARAALLPDSAGGRAVAVGVVILLAVGATALSMGKLPLWGVLLGLAGLSGAYEYPYTAAPPRFLDTSVSITTEMVLCVAIGFALVLLVMPRSSPSSSDAPSPKHHGHDEGSLDKMMEKSQ